MRKTAEQDLQALRGIGEFLGENEVTGAISSMEKHKEALAAAIGRLNDHAVRQDQCDRAFRAASAEGRALVTQLRREYIRPIVMAGKASFANDAGLGKLLSMPKTQGYEKVIAAALSIAGEVEKHKERFTVSGFEADFVDRLRAAAERVKVRRSEKDRQYALRAAATRGLEKEMSSAKALVRLLDSMIAPRLEETPERLAQWKTVVRFVPSRKARTVALPVFAAGTTPPAPVPTGGGMPTPGNITGPPTSSSVGATVDEESAA
jgi:hypothetical protein